MAKPCPACLEPLSRRPARCTACKAGSHEACWAEFGGCMACGGSETVRAARRKAPRSRVPMAWVPIVVFYLALQGLLQPVFPPGPPPPPRPVAQAVAQERAAPPPRRAEPRRCAPKSSCEPQRVAPRERPQRPTTARGLLRQADSLLRAGRVDAAYDRYKAAVDRDPRLAEAVLGCARTALRGGHLDRANYWLRYARELNPRSRRLARIQQRLEAHLASQRAQRGPRTF